MQNEKTKETVKRIFSDYLERNGYRKTSERYAILDEFYSREGLVDIDTLYDFLQEKNYHVSKATLYNTIEILLNCGLITKHKLGNNTARYERAFEPCMHDHLICTNCGAVLEFCDPRITQIQQTASELMNFEVNYRVLYFYGLCSDCRKKLEEEKNAK